MSRGCGQQVPAAGPPETRRPRRAPGNRGSSCLPAGPDAGPGAAAGRVGEQRAATEYQVGTAPLRDLPRSSPRAAAAARLLQGPARRPPHTSPHGLLASTPAVVGRGAALRVESSTAFHSLVIRDGGRAVFADRPHGPPITLRTRYILIRNGGELHLGWERCPCRSRATISLDGRAAEGAAVEGFGQKFVGLGRGGVLELHGGRPRSWTLLDKTPSSGGLPHGSSSSEQQRGSCGINPRTLDAGTGRALAAGASTPSQASASGCLPPWPCRPPAGCWRPLWGALPPATSRWRRGCCCGAAWATGSSPACAAGRPGILRGD